MTASRNDERLKELLTEAFPAGEPSQQLRERIASKAHSKQRTTPFNRFQMVRLVGVTAIAVACGIGLFNVNRWVAAEPLRRMQAALAKVETIHYTYHFTDAGRVITSGTDIEEGWEDVQNAWTRTVRRLNGPNGSTKISREELVRDGKQWIYDTAKNEVLQQKYHRGPGAVRTGFTISAIHQDMSKSTGVDVTVQNMGKTTKDSRPANHFRLVHQEPGAAIRIELYADRQTDLPFYGELYAKRRDDNQWRLHASMQMTYNATPPPDTFAVNFPKSATWRDMERERKEWTGLLEKGIARKTTTSGREFVIRHFHVGPDGDVTLVELFDFDHFDAHVLTP